MRSIPGILRVGAICVALLSALPGCPVAKFRLYLENIGSENVIVGVYLVDQNSTDPGWGPNLLNVDPQTGDPVPILPGEAVWLTHELIAGPTYNWMVQFANVVGDLELLPYEDVSETGDQLIFHAGMATSASVAEITSHAMLEPGTGGLPVFGIGYNWGPPEE